LGTTRVVKRVVVTWVVEVDSSSSAVEEEVVSEPGVVGSAGEEGVVGVVVGTAVLSSSSVVGLGVSETEAVVLGSTGQTVVEMAMVLVTTVPGQSVTVGAQEVMV
jgi:hypothetical protein